MAKMEIKIIEKITHCITINTDDYLVEEEQNTQGIIDLYNGIQNDPLNFITHNSNGMERYEDIDSCLITTID